MSSDMVERVALALAGAPWESVPSYEKATFRALAHSAIEAMRGWLSVEADLSQARTGGRQIDFAIAMIDAALAPVTEDNGG